MLTPGEDRTLPFPRIANRIMPSLQPSLPHHPPLRQFERSATSRPRAMRCSARSFRGSSSFAWPRGCPFRRSTCAGHQPFDAAQCARGSRARPHPFHRRRREVANSPRTGDYIAMVRRHIQDSGYPLRLSERSGPPTYCGGSCGPESTSCRYVVRSVAITCSIRRKKSLPG